MKKNIVVKDNSLINASYNLDLVEQRLILLAISKSQINGNNINAINGITIYASEYAEQFGINKNSSFELLKEASKNIFKRQFSYQEKNNTSYSYVISRWVSQITYNKNIGSVELIFAPAVIQLITTLEKRFTKYNINQISRLTSCYAIRLYEITKSWQKVGKTPIISIEDLRNKLGVIESQYELMTDFKKRILNIAVDQINKLTDINIEYKQHKNGTKIAGMDFKITTKENNAKIPIYETQITDDYIKNNAKPGESWKEAKDRIINNILNDQII